MNLELDGKRALVSGASRGIGLAIARALHAEGCHVAMMARGQDGLEKVAKEFGGRAEIRAGDASDPEAARALVADIDVQGGPLDILV